ncbi:TetR/AcrR family transcriptional regulator [uncultured Paraglaciecola sp.]|uniref:TetR/AcrR family transcriptional regulator n=1 Tax=uncultured Paraglaciecola sp. TaxID=1765024 RepID=UPI00261C19B8|nr:TetR/AcrR family transcriptional regulator [uncultured Paraglaciecola sp.]
MNKETTKAGRPKSAEKRNKILEAATDLFLSSGYSGCSMEMVAKQSGVSKQTVYSHFSNKEALFLAAIEDKCAEYQLDDRHLELEDSDLTSVLQERGLQIVKLLHDERVIAIYRVIIGEVNSSPRAAELFYQAGPKHNLEYLAQYFLKFAKQPLTEALADKCATMFFSLLKSEFHIKSILGLDFALSEAQQIAHVAFAIEQVERFIASTKS